MRSVTVLSALVIAAAIGPGCGGGNACADLVNAVNRASMAPGCAAALATAKSQAATIDVANCDPATSTTLEREASCFNALENCEGGDQNLVKLAECLKGAGAPSM